MNNKYHPLPSRQRRTGRKQAIYNLYIECNKYLSKDKKDDVYINNLLDKIKDIYDSNLEKFISLRNVRGGAAERNELNRKENILWRMGIECQKYLNIYLKDAQVGGTDGKNGKNRQTGRPVGTRGRSNLSGDGLFQGYVEF